MSISPLNTGIKIRDEQHLPPHITYEQYQQLVYSVQYHTKLKNFYETRDKLILHLLWETGGRVADIANLKLSDFNIQEKTLTMYVKKRKRLLTIPLSDSVLLDLLAYTSERNKYENKFKKNYLFDLTPTRIWQLVKSYGDKLGLYYYDSKNRKHHIHPHMFRHGLAIHLLERGIPIPIISARLGHSSTTTTINYYLVITPEIQRQMITENILTNK
jgi:integrase